ncbi:response regulator [Anabaena sp. UHCC 0187]|uniref:response regulator n=1 Tax=Anabaena sp. UHCC 0187 TaxID=2590018 RepID=UPI001447E971|nr:response regulator [Anabaena sp. UHCC 0187]MDP5018397.1 response regulator [Dolichospermum sp.]MTJ12658.1 response regulator [Anabaena sp. UHCC 0187]
MNTIPISRYRFFQKLQPITLLKKITNDSFTGCLQVFSESGAWSIYMDQGKLIYAGYSEEMFEPLYRNLQRLSQQISTLPLGINEQVRMIFEKDIENQSIPNPDYLAICWLVNQKYISHFQAALLIEQLALEVLESLLDLEYGSYEFVPHTFLDNLPKFCHLNLRTLVEQCQTGVKVNIQENLNFETYHQPEAHKKDQEQLTKGNTDQVDFEPNIKQPINSPVTERKKCSIFCVDDDYNILNTIEDFLDEKIFSIIKFMDSSQALMEILRVQPDIILLNVEMPDLDGYEICSLLRKHTNYKNTPVILMTERMGLRNRAKAKFVKANGYLEKPFSQGDLLKIIFQHIV